MSFLPSAVSSFPKTIQGKAVRLRLRAFEVTSPYNTGTRPTFNTAGVSEMKLTVYSGLSTACQDGHVGRRSLAMVLAKRDHLS